MQLTYKKRKNLKKGSFVFPGARRYPIEDMNHARNALARSSGKPEASRVKAAVHRKYPSLAHHKAVVKGLGY